MRVRNCLPLPAVPSSAWLGGWRPGVPGCYAVAMHKPARMLLGALMAALVVVGTTVAGPVDDAAAAYKRGDYATAMGLFRPLAEEGDASAQVVVGFMYKRGQGVPQDYAAAVRWYRLAADQGDASAQADLGFMYELGQGVKQDYAEAVRWYRLAADQGVATAQAALGFMYEGGRGVAQNYVLAHMWFNLSAARGFQRAAGLRDLLVDRMTPAQIAEAEKLARDWKPAGGP